MSTVNFHKTLYSLNSINSAAGQFKDFAEITVSSKDPYHVTELQPKNKDTNPDSLINEFKNYVLYQEIVNGDS